MPRLLLAALLASVTLGAVGAHAQQATASGDPVGFSHGFEPSTIGPGSVTTLTFYIANEFTSPITDLAFVNVLPAAITIATPARAETDCAATTDAGVTLTAPDGGSTISFSNGALGGSANCRVSVDVTSATAGTHTNTPGPLTGSQGSTFLAPADLTVDLARPGFTKAFAPASVVLGGRSTLTFTIDNSETENTQFSLAFVDDLPTGMEVASPSNAATTCSGGTVTADGQTVQLSNGSVDSNSICTVEVDVVTTGVGALGNTTGELTYFDGGTFTSFSSGKASAVLTSTSGGALQLTKAFLTNPVSPGGQTQLQFTLTNRDRSQSATGIAFTDDLGAALAGLTGSAPSTPDPACGAGSAVVFSDGGSVLSLTGGSLAPEETCTFEVMLDVPAGAAPGTYTNTTSGVTGTVGGDPVAGAAASAPLFVAYVPVLAMTFLDDPASPGDDVRLEFTVTNTDPASPLTDIAFDYAYGADLSGATVSALPPAGFCGAGAFAFTTTVGAVDAVQVQDGSLAPGTACTFEMTLTLPANFVSGTYPNSTSELSGTLGMAAVVGPAASDDLTVGAAPQLTKRFTPSSARPGTTTVLQFTLAHDANASSDATDIAFTDNLSGVLADLQPSAGQLPLAACGGTLQLQSTGFGIATVLEFVDGTLAPGEDCSFEVTLDVPVSAPYGTATNTTSPLSATVGGSTVTAASATADLWVTPFRFEKRFANMNQATPVLIYGIENVDPTEEATSLVFSDPLGDAIPGLSFGTLPSDPCGTGSSLFVSGTSLFLIGGTVPAGTFCVFQVPLVLPPGLDPGSYSSTSGDLTGQLGGMSVAAPGAVGSFTLNPRLPLFTKAFEPATILPEGVSRLTFTIDNTAQTVAASAIEFTDLLPDGVEVAATPNASKTCDGGMLTDTPMGMPLAGGETTLAFSGGSVAARTACTIGVDVTAAAEGTYLNTTSDLISSAGNSGTASATLTVVDPEVFVEKAVAFATDGDLDGEADAGDVLRYTVTITNRTGSAFEGVTFNDTPGAATALVGGSVVAFPGTVTSGDHPGDTEVAVALGSLAAMGSATVVFEVTVADPLDETLAEVCNQGTARGPFGTVLSDDVATSPFLDATCVDTDQPEIDLVITSHSAPARGESLEVFASAENTTDEALTYRRRLFLVHPDGRRTSFPADREVLGAGQTAPSSLVLPAIPIAADAPAGTYAVELLAVVLDPPVTVDTERFEFTLPPLAAFAAGVDLATVRPGAGPNPFLGRTMLRFPVLDPAEVDLRVFDAAGREVAVLVQGRLPKGLHEAEFDGTGRPAGVYFWRLTVGGDVTTGAVTLVR